MTDNPTPMDLDEYRAKLTEIGSRLPDEVRDELRSLHQLGTRGSRFGFCLCGAENDGAACCVLFLLDAEST